MSEIISFITILGAAGEEPAGIAALGIDPLAILAQAGTFLILFWVIKKFALEKIVVTLEARRKTIDDGVRIGRELEAEKQRLEEAVSKQLQKARKEADKIIAASHQEAGSILREAQEAASRKADALLADAHAKIEEDIVRARHELQKESLQLIAEATGAILEEKVDAQKDASLLERALAKVRSA